MPQLYNWYRQIKAQQTPPPPAASPTTPIGTPATNVPPAPPQIRPMAEQWEVWDHQSKQVLKQNLDAKRARRLADKWDSDYGAKRFVARQTHMPTASSKETGTPTVTPTVTPPIS